MHSSGVYKHLIFKCDDSFGVHFSIKMFLTTLLSFVALWVSWLSCVSFSVLRCHPLLIDFIHNPLAATLALRDALTFFSAACHCPTLWSLTMFS